jgi:hypothetical protein
MVSRLDPADILAGYPSFTLCVFLIVVVNSAGCGTQSYKDPDAYEAAVTDPQGPFVQSVTRNDITLRARYAPPALMSLDARRHLEETRRQVDTDPSNPNASSVPTSENSTDKSSTGDSYETTSAESPEGTGAPAARRRLKEAQARYEQARARSRRGLHFFLHLEPRQGDLVYERLKERGYRSYKEWLQKLMFGLGQKIALQVPGEGEVAPLTYRMQRTFGHGEGRTFLVVFPDSSGGKPLRDRPVELVVEEFGLGMGTVRFSFDLQALASKARLRPLSEHETSN